MNGQGNFLPVFLLWKTWPLDCLNPELSHMLDNSSTSEPARICCFLFSFFFPGGVSLCYPGWSQTGGLKCFSCLSLPNSWVHSCVFPHLSPWGLFLWTNVYNRPVLLLCTMAHYLSQALLWALSTFGNTAEERDHCNVRVPFTLPGQAFPFWLSLRAQGHPALPTFLLWRCKGVGEAQNHIHFPWSTWGAPPHLLTFMGRI